MRWNGHTYPDRFGNDWSIQEDDTEDNTRHVWFSCQDFQLIVVEADDEEADRRDLSLEQLKELFCDAERILELEDETWYVGYRTRSGGRGGQSNAGLHTRFRSESGEIRYAKGVINFRHMPKSALSEHLKNASPAARASA